MQRKTDTAIPDHCRDRRRNDVRRAPVFVRRLRKASAHRRRPHPQGRRRGSFRARPDPPPEAVMTTTVLILATIGLATVIFSIMWTIVWAIEVGCRGPGQGFRCRPHELYRRCRGRRCNRHYRRFRDPRRLPGQRPHLFRPVRDDADMTVDPALPAPGGRQGTTCRPAGRPAGPHGPSTRPPIHPRTNKTSRPRRAPKCATWSPFFLEG